MKLRNLALALLLLCGEVALAAVASGYYRLKSYNDLFLTENIGSHALVCSDEIAGSYLQVWRLSVSGNNVTLQNMLTERYISKTSGTAWSEQFQTTADNAGNVFTLGEDGDILTFTDLQNGGLHCDASQNVVLWLTNEAKSKWTVEEVTDIDISELQRQRLAIDNKAYTTELATFFTSTACIELKSSYQAMSDADLRSAMSDLPTAVQDMAVKVKNNAWATYEGWDKTEQTFRIADYKAYSSGSRWTSLLGLGHNLGRLSNPTGIYASSGDILQVYVGAIPSGETVKLEVVGTGQASGNIYELHEGRNSLLIASSGNCFVFYEVDNTTDGSAPYTALSSYADVTVHIEGGTVQGYFDLTKGDDNDDWAAMTGNVSLLTKPTVVLKSSTHVFNLHKERLVAGLGNGKKIVEMMTVWKDVADMEDRLMARGDFDGYCNNVYSVTTLDGTGNPHASTYGTYYYDDESGIYDIFNDQLLMSNIGGLWTITHEQGHNRQQLIKMIGTTEVSNNVFSTAALDWQGRYTSRVYNIQDTYNLFQQGMSWLERLNNKTGDYHLWECLHLYVQLYQYFHQAGFDTDFFPKLFRTLRESPMTFQAGTPVPASEDYLKFYKACCDASGRDLTEFFAAYGFFMLPPAQTPQEINSVSTGSYYQEINDYNTFYVYVDQAMIDNAKAYVAAKGYPRCNLIFIEDRVTAPLATYSGHTDGELRQLSMQDNVTAFGQVGKTGQYTTFGATPSAYTYYINANGGVTVQGSGAVGFKLYDGSGNLIALYNTKFFTLPSSTFDTSGLKSGYTLKAAAGDGSDAEMTYNAGAAVNSSLVPAVIGRQVTAESMLESGKPYLIYYVGNGNSAFLKDTGSAYTGKDDPTATEAAVYYLIHDGAGWLIKNIATGNYLGKPTANATSYIGTADEASAGSWALKFQTNGYIAPSCNGHSLNRSGNNIHAWSEGTSNVNQLAIYEVEDVEPLAGLSELTGDGWYRLRMTTPSTYEKLYAQNNSNETNYNDDRYPLTYQASVVLPTTDDADYFVRIIRNGANVQIQSTNGHYLNGYAKAALSATDVTVSYDTGFKFDNAYMPFSNSGGRIIGKSSGTTTTRFALYPVSLGGQGLQAWKVTLVNIPDDYTQITCTRGDAKGLTTVYNNGYIFLPAGVTPTASDFTFAAEVSGDFDIDASAHTIVAVYDPDEEGIKLDNTEVIQGNETAGKGNTMQALLRIKLAPASKSTPTQLNISLSGAAQIDNIAVYTTDCDELRFAGVTPTKVSADVAAAEGTLAIPLTMPAISAGRTVYMWVTADINNAAEEWSAVDASVSSLTYNNFNGASNTLDLSSNGNPDGEMRIYKQQQFLWTASKSNAKYYRIPTIINTADGGIAAFTDDRYTASGDLGSHKIDVVMRKSMDNGVTWAAEKYIAVGDGSSDAAYGYGDIAVVRTVSGKLIGLLAAGKSSYPSGMLHMGYIESTDNGATWTEPVDIYSSINKNGLELSSVFTTAGKGVTFSNGRVAFAMNGKVSGTTNEYVIYSDDEGQSWSISPTVAFTGADESKLEIMNDNSLLMSIRCGGFNFMANRGYNRTTGDASGDGIDNWGTQGNWDNEMNANGCNADILYYNRSTEDAGRPDVIFHTLTKTYSTYRKDLRLYMSFDQGTTWKEAFQLQPGYAAYSSMQKLANGDLAIIFEDGSIGNKDKQDCYAINYIVISSESINAKIDELYETVINPLVKNSVLGSATGANSYGSFTDASNGWAKVWTSNASSGVAGLTITAPGYDLNHASVYNQRCLAMRPSADGATDEITITAPAGYYIDSYTITGRNYSSSQAYQLYVDENAKITTSISGATLSVDNVNAQSTSFKFYGSSASTNYLCISNFTIQLRSQYPVTLNTVGDASYATLYLPFAVTTDDHTKAYVIRTVGTGYAKLSELENGEIAANTAVVLINESSNAATFTVAKTLTRQISESENWLKGTLTPFALDLSDETPYYSMGRKDGEIGFYKFDNEETTTITLGANKAYLDTSAPTGAVKGFRFSFDIADAISGIQAGGSANDKWYDLSGRQMVKGKSVNGKLPKGIYITNGKKIFIK